MYTNSMCGKIIFCIFVSLRDLSSRTVRLTTTLLIGVNATLAFVILCLHIFSTKTYSILDEGCVNEKSCLELYKNVSNLTRDEVVEAVRDNFLFPPPSSTAKETIDFDNYYPPWKELMQWDSIQEMLLTFFQDQPGGTFVEIGAVDGLFLSQTFYLEKRLNWTGLLIEPDPRSFSRMLENNRNSTKAKICISNIFPCAQKFWLRRMEKDLPEHFEQVLLARSILGDEVMEADESKGSCISTPCVPLSLVALAANIKTIDFLTIATGGEDDQLKIEDALLKRIVDVKTLLMHIPAAVQQSRPIVRIPGYIVDAVRSHVIYKFYIKKSYCKLQSTTDCVKIDHFVYQEACLKYLCFGNIDVNVVDESMYVLVSKAEI